MHSVPALNSQISSRLVRIAPPTTPGGDRNDSYPCAVRASQFAAVVSGEAEVDFEKGYRAFLEERVKKGPKQVAQKQLAIKALQDAQAKDPENPDLAAQLADRYYSLGNKKEARRLYAAGRSLKSITKELRTSDDVVRGWGSQAPAPSASWADRKGGVTTHRAHTRSASA